MSDGVWLAILGIISMVIKEYFDRERFREADKKRDTLEAKVEQVHVATNTLDTKVEQVHVATNSMHDALVEKAELAGELKAIQAAQARASSVPIEPRLEPEHIVESPK